ncbi:MAG: ATP-binding protein [Chloroflexota bacterium]
MREIALHILDIAENSVSAGAQRIEISVEEDLLNDRLNISIKDDGRGMDKDLLASVTNPFVTSRTTRKVGLGLPLFKAAAEACGGHLHLDSTPGRGATVDVQFQRSHIDRMPLGDLVGTWRILLVGFPDVRWLFRYRAKIKTADAAAEFVFDSEPLKQELQEVPITEPTVLAFIKGMLQEGVKEVQRTISQADLIR